MDISIKGTAKGSNLVDMVDRAIEGPFHVNTVDRAIAKAKATPQDLTAHERDIALGSGEFDDAVADARVARVVRLVQHYRKGMLTSTEFVQATAWAITSTGPFHDSLNPFVPDTDDRNPFVD